MGGWGKEEHLHFVRSSTRQERLCRRGADRLAFLNQHAPQWLRGEIRSRQPNRHAGRRLPSRAALCAPSPAASCRAEVAAPDVRCAAARARVPPSPAQAHSLRESLGARCSRNSDPAAAACSARAMPRGSRRAPTTPALARVALGRVALDDPARSSADQRWDGSQDQAIVIAGSP
jgi:hypothetical protein